MDFTASAKRAGSRSKIKREFEKFPHPLQLYTLPPTDDVSLQEFEEFAVDRLKVLQAVETAGIKNIKGTTEYDAALKNDLQNIKVSGSNSKRFVPCGFKEMSDLLIQDFTERQRDHISHFILRLAYCRTEELRRWFIAQEMDLFRYRFRQETSYSIAKFLEINKLDYKPIPDGEKEKLQKDLEDTAHGASMANTDFYKVPFTEALDLVKSRRVYLVRGYAYVPQNELVVIILSLYRTNLSHALAVASRALPQLEEDGRLLPLLTGLSKRYLGQDYSTKKPSSGVISADKIEGLSLKSFPPCMQQTHQALRRHHHLKHWGRMQYGLFLKAIGVPLEEAMKFWRAEFCKAIDPDKFDKSYSYNIRHNYGKEGKRADYTPYSCIKIITSNAPGPGDHHGCPFRHTDSDLLHQRLQAKGFPKDVNDEIQKLVKSSHYQLACGKYFEHTHKLHSSFNFNPNHPNQYFDESQKVLNGEGKPLEDITGSQNRTVRIVASQSKRSHENSSLENTLDPDDSFDDAGNELLSSMSMDVESAQ